MAKPRVRAKSAPKLGGTDANFVILGAIKSLVRWATANRVENSSLGWGSIDPLMAANAMTGAHVHGTPGCNCQEPRCKKAAVCKALGELLAGYEVPLAAPIRALAQSVFDMASALKRVSAEIEPRLLKAGLELDEELRKGSVELRAARRRATWQLRRKGLPPLPRPKKGQPGPFDVPHAHKLLCLAPHAAAGELRAFADRLIRFDLAIRDTLTNPVDRGPRTGGRPLDAPLACATWHLHRGGFTAREIAHLIVEAGDETDRIKRVHGRLRRLRAHVKKTGNIPWTVFASESLEAQEQLE
jgi:hypothetical protein